MHMSKASARKKPRVTMADVAQRAGCDPSTVSLALRDHPRIPRATVARIRRIAAEIGYQRNAAFEMLARQRWGGEPSGNQVVLALLRQSRGPRGGPRALLQGALEAAARDKGYQIDEFFLDDVPDGRVMSRMLHSRGIEGIILAPSALTQKVPKLEWEKFSVVALHSERPVAPFHQVVHDYFDISRLAVRRAREAGSCRIGFVLLTDAFGERDYPRLGGFLAEMHLTAPSEIPLTLFPSFADAKREIASWFRRWRPEVVIGSSELVADSLNREGIRFPRDCRFISLRETNDPAVACVTRNVSELGAAAASLIDSELKLNRKGLPAHPLRITVLPGWHSGSSLTG